MKKKTSSANYFCVLLVIFPVMLDAGVFTLWIMWFFKKEKACSSVRIYLTLIFTEVSHPLNRIESLIQSLFLPFADCLECMACSDNVVRAGLTPKFKDIQTLCSMLNYEPGTVDRYRTKWNQVDEYYQICTVPVPDFAMARLCLPAIAGSYKIPICSSGSILLILQGEASFADLGSFTFGKVIFLKAHQQLTVQALSAENVVIYQAFSNVWLEC